MCPLGALLGVFSRFTILTLVKDEEKCTGCNACTKSCQGAAEPKPGKEWQTAECLMCFNCFDSCPEDALSFRFRWSSPQSNKKPDMGRRAVLAGILAGVSFPLLGRLDGQAHTVSNPRLIRPPGSLAEKDFLTLCQRCGLCMKVCPFSHPETLVHNLVREGIRRSAFARTVSVWGDRLLYGRRVKHARPERME